MIGKSVNWKICDTASVMCNSDEAFPILNSHYNNLINNTIKTSFLHITININKKYIGYIFRV